MTFSPKVCLGIFAASFGPLVFAQSDYSTPYAITTFAGSAGSQGSTDGIGGAARFSGPYGIAVDSVGNVYVAEFNNHTIRKITAAGVVSTLAGQPGASGSANGTGSAARFSVPAAIAVDSGGNLYVADYGNHLIRKITASGAVSTLAGTAGVSGTADGTGSAARFNGPDGIAVDLAGNVYVADLGSNTIRKVTSAGVVTTLAGTPGVRGNINGTGAAARFYAPYGVAVDAGGSVYVSEGGNNQIRKITSAGVVTTLAGTTSEGSADGSGTNARFREPSGLAIDGAGNLYVADFSNHTVRRISPTGTVATLAGFPGTRGSTDGAGSVARFSEPNGIAVDSAGNVYVADSSNSTIRKGVPPTSSGDSVPNDNFSNATVLSGGSGQVSSTLVGATIEAGDPVLSATLPLNGSVWYRWTALTTGTVRFQLSGQGFQSYIGAYVGSSLATLTTLSQNTVSGFVTISASAGASYVIMVDRWSGTASSFSLSWADVETPAPQQLSGSGTASGSVGESFMYMLSFSGSPTVYAATGLPPGLLLNSSSGVISGIPTAQGSFTVPVSASNSAGTGIGTVFVSITATNYSFATLAGTPGVSGGTDGAGGAARFHSPVAVAVDSAANLYVADGGNLMPPGFGHTIRKVTSGGAVTTLAGLTGVSGSTNGTGSAARFYSPQGVAVDSAGNVYVSDYYNSTIRKVTSSGTVTTLAGLLGATGSTDGAGGVARFASLAGLGVDSAGNIYAANSFTAHSIRKVTGGGVVTTLAGAYGLSGSADGSGSSARFNTPTGVAVDSAGNVFVADMANHAIRKINSAGVVTTLAGLAGSAGSADGAGSAARFNSPRSVAVDTAGNVYVADTSNHTIRKITSSGVVTTIGGTAGSPGAVNGTGDSARFTSPLGVAVDSGGNIYVAENFVIRKGVPAVALASPPIISIQPPENLIVVPGLPATLTATATANPTPSYQWFKDGVALPGATSSSLTVGTISSANAGNYHVVVSNSAGSVTSSTTRLIVSTGSALANLSVRTTLAANQTVIVGAVVNGGAKNILVRAAGPALNQFGLVGMADPRLDLFTTGVVPVASNDDWPSSLASTFVGLGAFAFPTASKDAALLQSLGGAFTVQARGTGPGAVLVEAYDANGGGTGQLPRMVNVSARNRVGTGSDVLIAGLALSGLGTKQVLIRAVGPGLIPFGVTGTLADPRLQVFNANSVVIATNDNWDPALAPTFAQVSAFALTTNSKDAAILVTLNAGATYTVQVSGAEGGTGEALIEVYEIP